MKTNVKTNKNSNQKKVFNKKTFKNSKKNQKKKKNLKKTRKITIFISLIIVLTIIGVLVLFSSLFNIKQITVINNSKVTTQEVIQKSGLILGNNMFRTLKHTIREGIKTNSYIEDVKITKKLNGEIILDIEERVPTYILQCEEGYAYINNQGYILEVSRNTISIAYYKGA